MDEKMRKLILIAINVIALQRQTIKRIKGRCSLLFIVDSLKGMLYNIVIRGICTPWETRIIMV